MTHRADLEQIQQMAEEIFDVMALSWINTGSDDEKDMYDLSETEILTLHLLTQNESMNVGELQGRIGVSPTKMSRVIRGLEREAARPLVECRFNAQDRRKVDVSITDVGRKAHRAYRSGKLANTMRVLAEMCEADRAELIRLLRILRQKLLEAFASRR